MGLDMYMYRRLQGETELPDTEVLYLRKANQVRKWIVDHTGYDADSNCSVYKLTKDQLEELLADCRAVQEDNMLAHRLLPTGGGYFFGAVEYNDIYFDTLKKAIEQLEEILIETDFQTDEIVYFEWW